MGSQMDCLSAPIETHDGRNLKDNKSVSGHSTSSSSLSSIHFRRSHSNNSHNSHSSNKKEEKPHRHRVKILFLDVDGVLNGENYGYGGVDDSLLFLLKTIIDETKCKIVLSTTWRLNQSARATLLHFMKARADINVEDIIIGDTPSIKGKKRAFEIESFLNSEEFISQYYCTRWCAIDDLALNQHNPIFMKNHFVRTNYRTGITSNDAFHVVQILNKDEEYSNSYDY